MGPADFFAILLGLSVGFLVGRLLRKGKEIAPICMAALYLVVALWLALRR